MTATPSSSSKNPFSSGLGRVSSALDQVLLTCADITSLIFKSKLRMNICSKMPAIKLVSVSKMYYSLIHFIGFREVGWAHG
jgi:hypothetical protein